MKKFILLLSVIFLSSCRSGQNDCCTDYLLGFQMLVKNSEGEDLLNPNTPNSLNTDKIKLFYLKNGVKEEVYHPTADHPRNYFIFLDSNGQYRIGVNVNYAKSEPFPITYIQWNENDMDTIISKLEYKDSGISIEKLWYNNELKIDFSNPQYSDWVFEIVK